MKTRFLSILLLALIWCFWLKPMAVNALAQPDFDIADQCFAVADERRTQAGEDSLDTLVRLNRTIGVSAVIGLTGTRNVEAIAFGPNNVLYAADASQLGTLNLDTGRFTPLAEPFGFGRGSAGLIHLNDADGLTYDLANDRLYATDRREGLPTDLLFAVDRTTGAHLSDFFGTSVDYVEIPRITDEDGEVLADVDDIAVDPRTTVMYATINQGGRGGVLATVDPSTGVATRVATFRYPNPYPTFPALAGQIIDDMEGLSFFNDGQLYGSTGDNGPDKLDSNKLFRIDKATGVGTLVAPFPYGHEDYEGLGCLTAQAFVTLEKQTNGSGQAPENADTPTGPLIQVGQPVFWTYTITNTGSITLTDLQLTDNPIGLLGPGGVTDCPPAGTILGPGEGISCIVSGVAQAGQYTNTAQITGTTQLGVIVPRQTVTASDTSHYFGISPAIDLQKLTNGQDADDPNGADVPEIAPGAPVTWTYIVRNTGNTSFNENTIFVTDTILGPITTITDKGNGDNMLSPGEAWSYQALGQADNLLRPSSSTVTVAGCDADQTGIVRPAYENRGEVVAGNVAAFDFSHYCNPPAPVIAIEKLTNGHQATDPNGHDVPQIAPGDPVTWTYSVTNIGNVPFTANEIVVTDSVIGPVTTLVNQGDGDALLAPNEVWLYEAVGVATDLLSNPTNAPTVPGCDPTQNNLPRPAYENIGVVTVRGVTDRATSHYCNPPGPAINIEKLTNNQDADDPNGLDVPHILPDGVITWTYIITNTGNEAFRQEEISVTDDIIGPVTTIIDQGDGDAILSPGEVWVYQALGVAENLALQLAQPNVIQGCNAEQTAQYQPTYRNIGLVQAGAATDLNPSYYCNHAPIIAPTAIDPQAEPSLPAQHAIFLPLVTQP